MKLDDVSAYNASLLTRGDDSIVECEKHGVSARWGDLSDGVKMMIMEGLDNAGDECCLAEER